MLIDEAEETFTNGINIKKSVPEGIQNRKDSEKNDVIIEINNLSYIYMPNTPYERQALKDVTISIRKGELLGVIGHTGSGKSTLIQHLNGLLSPSSGSIEVSGIVPKGKALKELRRKVGLIFQNPEDQLFEETVKKDISFGLNKIGLSAEEIEKRIQEALEITGLSPELLEKSPFEAFGRTKKSGGDCRRHCDNPEYWFSTNLQPDWIPRVARRFIDF